MKSVFTLTMTLTPQDLNTMDFFLVFECRLPLYLPNTHVSYQGLIAMLISNTYKLDFVYTGLAKKIAPLDKVS